MVILNIDDEVWNVYRRSWALWGVRTHEELIRMLEQDLWEKSNAVLDFAEEELIDDTPEAYVQRQIGLEKERLEKARLRKTKAFRD